MTFADYERPATLRGLHGSHTNTVSFDRPKWLDIVRSVLPHGGWFKIVDTENAGQKEWARMLRGAGIMPIIRPFLPTCTPVPDALKAYIIEGITKWIEPWNEPNIDEGWPGRENFTGVAELVDSWLAEAEKIISWGGYPAFPSFAQCGPHPDYSSVKWYKLLFAYMGDHCRDRARAVFLNGAWLAVHDAVLNRFWKDQEGQYHFEHPYSELVYEHIGWRPTLWEDDSSLIGHQVPVYLMKKHLGEDIDVPVISTEGGVFAALIGVQADGAYPAFDEGEHARATVAMYRWLERYQKTYPWYFGMCPWKFAPFGHQHDAWPGDNWIKKGGKRLAVVEAVKRMGPSDPDAKPIGPIGLFREEPMEKPIRVLIREDITDPGSAKIRVDTLELEGYLRGVVPCEMPPSWPKEALKAQAVAARCYAERARAHPRHEEDGADLCNTEHCQVWLPSHFNSTDEAVEETRGIVARYEGQIINAFYSGHCGGRTLGNEEVWGGVPLPYCRGVDCIAKGKRWGSEQYGHRVGLCQWGAHDMAQQGHDYITILKHYYEGITIEGAEIPCEDRVRELEAIVAERDATIEDYRNKARGARDILDGMLES